MKFLDRIFDVFSRRPESKEFKHEVPMRTRKRIFLWLRDIYGNRRSSFHGSYDYTETFWNEIHLFLQHRHGEFSLTNKHGLSRMDDAAEFLLDCKPEDFLDFLEYIFRVECFLQVSMPKNGVVDELNGILRVDKLPYHMTRYQERKMIGQDARSVVIALSGTHIEPAALPKVVMRESEVIHQHAIEPTLHLLEEPAFGAANQEFLSALEDYRKGDWADCMVKCCSAFESSMKVICNEKNWSYQETDTASKLLRTILPNVGLPNFFEPPLILIATLRNKLSSAHGAGTASRSPSRAIAHYSINSTAAAIVFLAEEAGLK